MDEWLKRQELEAVAGRHVEQPAEAAEYTGGSVSYYKAPVAAPLSGGAAYVAECNDIIEALGRQDHRRSDGYHRHDLRRGQRLQGDLAPVCGSHAGGEEARLYGRPV